MKITEEIKKHKSYLLKCNYSINGNYRYYIAFNDNEPYKRISEKLYNKINNINIGISQDDKFHIIADNISII